MIRFFFIFFFCVSLVLYLQSQDIQIDGIKNQVSDIFKEKYKISGGVNFSNVYLFNPALSGSAKESNIYTISGNINMTLFKYIDLPFMYSYSNANAQSTLTNPSFSFNRFYIAPKYKKWTLQLGQNISVSLTPQTLAGLPFTGSALEYAGTEFSGQILYGKFFDGIKEDTLRSIIPTYKRNGLGLKTSYNKGEGKYEFMLFYAADEPNSIPKSIKNIDLMPQAGLSTSILVAIPIIRYIAVETECHLNSYTNNLNDNNVSSNSFIRLLPSTNASTNTLMAFKISPKFKIRKISLSLSYERVEPNFKSIGNLNIINDFQNMVMTIATPLFNNKFTVTGSAGLNYSDIYNKSPAVNNKFVYAFGIMYPISKEWNFSFNYSNNQVLHVVNAFVKASLQNKATLSGETILLDTLNTSIINSSYSSNLSYNNTQSKKYAQSASWSATITEVYKLTENILNLGELTRTVANTLTYNFNHKKSQLTISPTLNINWSYTALLTQTIISPSLNLSKKIFDQKLTLSNNYSFNQINSSLVRNNVLNIRFGMNTVVLKKHSLSLVGTMFFKNISLPKESQNFNANFSYAYAF